MSAITTIIKAGLFIVPFIPLYVSKVLFFPYITGKAFVFRIVIEIVFAAWVFLAIFYKEYRPKKSYLLTAISIFILVATLATIFGVNPARSFWSNYERMEGLVTYLHLFAYFLVLTSVFQKKDWKIFFNLFVVAGLLENIYALFQKLGYLTSDWRVYGTIGNPTYLAAYLVFILAFCILLWLDAKGKLAKYYYGLVGLWTLITIYLTASRGPTLAILIGAFAAAGLYFIFTRKKVILVVLLALLAIPGGLWAFRGSSFIKNTPAFSRLTSYSFKDRTITSRFTIWGMGWEGFKERPVLGWGPDNYGIVFAKYFQPEIWNQEPWFDRSHNIVFDWLINAGILGLLSYLGIFISALYLLWKAYVKKSFQVGAAVLIPTLFLVYFFQNLFVFDNIATYICFFTVLAFIHNIATTETASVDPRAMLAARREKLKLADAGLIAGLLLVPLVLIIYFINAKPLFANLSLLNAMNVQNLDVQGVFKKYDEALSYNTLGNQEIREQFIHYVLAVGGMAQLDAGFRDTIIRRAIQEAEKGVQENPLDPRPYLFLGVIYSRIGLLDDALKVMNGALALSPKKQQIAFEIADLYIQKEDYAGAIKVLKNAFESDKTDNFARINLASAYILNNQQEEADKLIIEFYGKVDISSPTLISVYTRVKNYSRLVGVRKAALEEYPNNWDNRKNLAGAYLLNNRPAEAIKVLEEGIRLNPAVEAEAEALISEIRTK